LPTLREIRKRIRSIKNIAQVTRAMQTVAASKMRRSQQATLATRPYADKSWEVLSHLVGRLSQRQLERQPLLRERPVQTIGLLVVGGTRGLCGGYNHNVLEAAAQFILAQTAPVKVITVGRKAHEYMARRDVTVAAEFDVSDHPGAVEVTPIAHLLMADLEKGVFDQVWLVYTEFVSTLKQVPRVRRLLPVEAQAAGSGAQGVPYLLEPDPESILGPMLRRFTELQVYRSILEAQASEQSARMVAMRAATDNAVGLIAELTLSYNKARQEAMTKEILDIVGGAAALSQARSATS
jgi:F-type H+-transporting ATPase subunit gamma